MPEFTLTAEPPLAGYDHNFGTAHLRAPAGLAFVSIALPLGGEDAALKAVKSAYGVAMPEVGQMATAKDGAILMRMSVDQGFVLFAHDTPDANVVVNAKLKGKAYTTDQTDVWCALELSGARARDALERICPLDLNDSGFSVGEVKRTMMEHLGTLIARKDADTWVLMSASSSAGSFLHAIETSIHNVS
ncbi:MAG: sarcosine oxidase subunit gamma [Roseovarius sp.]